MKNTSIYVEMEVEGFSTSPCCDSIQHDSKDCICELETKIVWICNSSPICAKTVESKPTWFIRSIEFFFLVTIGSFLSCLEAKICCIDREMRICARHEKKWKIFDIHRWDSTFHWIHSRSPIIYLLKLGRHSRSIYTVVEFPSTTQQHCQIYQSINQKISHNNHKEAKQ